MRVLSLGWGVQSFTLAAMAAVGELPALDFAIHADTTWERRATYEFAAEWTPWLEERGVRVMTVREEQVRKVVSARTEIPAFTFNGQRGQLRRQCTQRWKIYPMRRFILAELKRRGVAKRPGVVEQWIGISVDEWQRAKDSDVAYIQNRFPLLDLGMTRADCLRWLHRRGLAAPGKSACVFCPYHNMATWYEMKRRGGSDWEMAVRVDEGIRDKRPPFALYVHPKCVPLPEAVIVPEEFGYTQLDLLAGTDICDSGHCFL